MSAAVCIAKIELVATIAGHMRGRSYPSRVVREAAEAGLAAGRALAPPDARLAAVADVVANYLLAFEATEQN